MTYRTDGLDNPFSPNSRSLSWDDVERLAEESDAVEAYGYDGDDIVIEWCDGTESRKSNPQAAFNEIREMSRSS